MNCETNTNTWYKMLAERLTVRIWEDLSQMIIFLTANCIAKTTHIKYTLNRKLNRTDIQSQNVKELHYYT